MRVDWRGLSIASAFIALMYADFFLCHGWLSGLVVGGVFGLVGIAVVVQNVWMIRVGRLVTAVVVDHKEAHSDDEVHYIPIVEFSDRYGQRLRKQTDAGLGVKRPSIGTRVLVRYDPTGKLDCQIMSIARWGIPLALLSVGAIVLGLAAMEFMK